MLITGARVARAANVAESINFSVNSGRIRFGAPAGSATLHLDGFLILPGLINSHDHLSFALCPKLGTGLYRNAAEWARDVYRPDESPLKEHRSIPRETRLRWGGIRNLLSGVTTVAHHDPWHPAFDAGFPVRVLSKQDWAHSLDYPPDPAAAWRSREPGRPFILHAAEGVDEPSRREIGRLDAMGVLGSDTVLVHALGVDEDGIRLLRERGSSMVFCPNSNLALYGRTLSLATLRSGIRVALGTDSPMTSGGDLRDNLATARKMGLSAAEIYPMITTAAADVLRLREGEGSIEDGGVADLVAVRDHGQTPAEALFDLRPEMVMAGGELKLLSETLAAHAVKPFQRIQVDSQNPAWIDSDVAGLMLEAERLMGVPCSLDGKRIR